MLVSAAVADSSTTTDLLWPLPHYTSFGSEVYSLNSQTFNFLGAGAGGGSSILEDAFLRYQLLIFSSPAPFYPSGGGSAPAQELASLLATVNSADETLGLNTNESCELRFVDVHVLEI